MKRRYLAFTIRQLKAKLSHLSRTTFRITRNFFKSRFGINKRDWSRLNKAEIIRVLNYYYASLAPKGLVKTLLSGHQFKPTSPETFTSLLPKLPVGSGQQWRLIDQDDVSELSNFGIPLYYAHFQKVYPPNHQMDIWDNPDCLMVIAELKNQFCVHISDGHFSVIDFFEEIERQYISLRT